ncbi:MAG TPA: hypothetical protein VN414_10200, partial [Methanosarcina sp.]|nr:hypothetical protein [Methanosarcina sp.]
FPIRSTVSIKGSYGLDIQREKRRGEGSLHPQSKEWGIRDPLRSRCNKEQENFDETPKFVFDTFYAYTTSSDSKPCSSHVR